MSEAASTTPAPSEAQAPFTAVVDAPVGAPTVADGKAAEAPPEGAAAPVVEAKVEEPEKKPEPKEFLELKRQKREVHQAKQQAREVMQQAEQLKTQLQPFATAIQQFDDDPLAFVQELARATGKSATDVFDRMIVAASKHGDAPDPNDRVSKLEAQIRAKEIAEQQEAEARAAAEAEKVAEAEWQSISNDLGQFIASQGDAYECVQARGPKAHKDLMRLGDEWSKVHNGETLTLQQGLDLLEAQYLDEDRADWANRFSKSKKLQALWAPPAPTPAPVAPAAASTPANEAAKPAASGDTANHTTSPLRKITHRQAAVPAGATRVIRRPSSSERETIQRAVAMLPDRYQPKPST